MMNNSKWQILPANLHPELVRLGVELGITPVAANGRNQSYLNQVWVGYYAGPWGSSPWQVGPQRVCMSREALVALLTKGEEPAVTTPSLRNFTEVAMAKAKLIGESTKPVASPVAALVAPAVETPAMKIARLTAAVEAKKAAAAAAVAATEEEAAIIAALEAELAK